MSFETILQEELQFCRAELTEHRAKAWIAGILVEALERELGYTADSPPATDMMWEGSPINTGGATIAQGLKAHPGDSLCESTGNTE